MYLGRYNRPGAEAGWHALTGAEASITRLAKSVGFRYTYSAKLNLYAHAAGFVLLLDVLLNIADGRPLRKPEEGGPAPLAGAVPQHETRDVGDLRYEVMYFLEAPDETIPAFKDVWAGIGDSIVVVGGNGLWNCHIHTDDIGAALEAALDAGRPRNIRVTDPDTGRRGWIGRTPHKLLFGRSRVTTASRSAVT